MRKMFSSKDFQKLWFLYQTEGAPKGISIQSFCETNGVPYDQYSGWFKRSHQAVSKVEIDGMPEEVKEEPKDEKVSEPISDKRGILVNIKTRDGLNIRKGNLTYEELKDLVARLEGLC